MICTSYILMYVTNSLEIFPEKGAGRLLFTNSPLYFGGDVPRTRRGTLGSEGRTLRWQRTRDEVRHTWTEENVWPDIRRTPVRFTVSRKIVFTVYCVVVLSVTQILSSCPDLGRDSEWSRPRESFTPLENLDKEDVTSVCRSFSSFPFSLLFSHSLLFPLTSFVVSQPSLLPSSTEVRWKSPS